MLFDPGVASAIAIKNTKGPACARPLGIGKSMRA
jgi:hypothetical protein